MALDNFNFDGPETMRADYIKRAFAAMADIYEDKNQKAEDRVMAAKVTDGMSDSILKTNLMTEVHRDYKDTKRQVLKSQLKKLEDED